MIHPVTVKPAPHAREPAVLKCHITIHAAETCGWPVLWPDNGIEVAHEQKWIAHVLGTNLNYAPRYALIPFLYLVSMWTTPTLKPCVGNEILSHKPESSSSGMPDGL